MFLSPMPSTKNNLQLVAQFNLYVDTNDFKDGKIAPIWESKVDKMVYRNDCEALYDLRMLTGEICDTTEVKQILEFLNNLNPQDTIKTMKL